MRHDECRLIALMNASHAQKLSRPGKKPTSHSKLQLEEHLKLAKSKTEAECAGERVGCVLAVLRAGGAITRQAYALSIATALREYAWCSLAKGLVLTRASCNRRCVR